MSTYDELRDDQDLVTVVTKVAASFHRTNPTLIDFEDLYQQLWTDIFSDAETYLRVCNQSNYAYVRSALNASASRYLKNERRARFPDWFSYSPNQVKHLLDVKCMAEKDGMKVTGATGEQGLSAPASERGDWLAAQCDLDNAIKRLTKNQYRVLLAIHLQPDLPRGDIARGLDMATNSLNAAYTRAITKLCQLMTQHDSRTFVASRNTHRAPDANGNKAMTNYTAQHQVEYDG